MAVHQVYQFHKNMWASCCVVKDIKISKTNTTLADGLIERTSSMLDEIE